MSSHVDATALDLLDGTAAASSRCKSKDNRATHGDAGGLSVTQLLIRSDAMDMPIHDLPHPMHGDCDKACMSSDNSEEAKSNHDEYGNEGAEEEEEEDMDAGMRAGSPIRFHSRMVPCVDHDAIARAATESSTHGQRNEDSNTDDDSNDTDSLLDSGTVSFVIGDEEEDCMSDDGGGGGELNEEMTRYLQGSFLRQKSLSNTGNSHIGHRTSPNDDTLGSNRKDGSSNNSLEQSNDDNANRADEDDDDDDEACGRGSPRPVTLLGAARDLRRKRIKRVSNYILGPLLGEGACGVVRDAIDISGERGAFRRCAVKIVNLPRPRSADVAKMKMPKATAHALPHGAVLESNTSRNSNSFTMQHREGHATAGLSVSRHAGSVSCSNAFHPSISSSPAAAAAALAAQRIQHYPSEQARQVVMFRNEIKNLQRFHCRYLIRAEDIFSRYGKEYVVMPFAVCTLAQMVRVSRNLRDEQTREAAEERARQQRLRLRHQLECAQQPMQTQGQGQGALLSTSLSSSCPTSSASAAVATRAEAPMAEGELAARRQGSSVWLEVASSPPSLTQGVFGRSEHHDVHAAPTSCPMVTLLPASGAKDAKSSAVAQPCGNDFKTNRVHGSNHGADMHIRCSHAVGCGRHDTSGYGSTDGKLNSNNGNVSQAQQSKFASPQLAPPMEPLLAPTLIKDLMFQVLSGLAYLHKQNIAHNDVKLENTLLFENGNVALCDLGSVGEHYADQGTPLYASPELCRIFYGMNSGSSSSSSSSSSASSSTTSHDGGAGDGGKNVAANAAAGLSAKRTVDAKAYDMWCCGIMLYSLITGLPGPLPVHRQRRKPRSMPRRVVLLDGDDSNSNIHTSSNRNKSDREALYGGEMGNDCDELMWYTRFQLYRIIADFTGPVDLSDVPDLIDAELGSDDVHDLYKAHRSDGDATIHGYATRGVRHLLAWLLHVDPSRRCTVEQALRHPWITPTFRSCRSATTHGGSTSLTEHPHNVAHVMDRNANDTILNSSSSSDADSYTCSSNRNNSTTEVIRPNEVVARGGELALSRKAMEDAIARDVARRVLHSPQFKAILREDRVSHLQFVADCCHILRIHLPREIVREPTAEPYEYDEEESRVTRQRHFRVTRQLRNDKLYRLTDGNGACGPRHMHSQRRRQQQQGHHCYNTTTNNNNNYNSIKSDDGANLRVGVCESALQGVQVGVVVVENEDDDGDEEVHVFDDNDEHESEYARRYAQEEEQQDECEYVDYTGDERVRRFMPAVLPRGCVDPLLFLPFSEENYYYLKGARAEFDVRNLVHAPRKVLQLREYLFNTVLVQCGYRTRADPRYTVARNVESVHKGDCHHTREREERKRRSSLSSHGDCCRGARSSSRGHNRTIQSSNNKNSSSCSGDDTGSNKNNHDSSKSRQANDDDIRSGTAAVVRTCSSRTSSMHSNNIVGDRDSKSIADVAAKHRERTGAHTHPVPAVHSSNNKSDNDSNDNVTPYTNMSNDSVSLLASLTPSGCSSHGTGSTCSNASMTPKSSSSSLTTPTGKSAISVAITTPPVLKKGKTKSKNERSSTAGGKNGQRPSKSRAGHDLGHKGSEATYRENSKCLCGLM